MNFRTVNVIISREYLTRVKKKSFLLTTFLGPIFFAALCILPSVIMFMAEDKGKKIGVMDESGIVMPYMTDSEQIAYQDYSSEPVDSMKARYFDLELDALVIISPLDSATKSVSVSAYSQKPLSVDMKEAVSRNVNNAIEDYYLAAFICALQIGKEKQVDDLGSEYRTNFPEGKHIKDINLQFALFLLEKGKTDPTQKDRFFTVAKEALPITRLSIMRPATVTSTAFASSASASISPYSLRRSPNKSLRAKSFG